jgi:hypothetical protein
LLTIAARSVLFFKTISFSTIAVSTTTLRFPWKFAAINRVMLLGASEQLWTKLAC